jgi:hypothetical protein
MTGAASDDTPETTIGTQGFCANCPYYFTAQQQCRRNPPLAAAGVPARFWPKVNEHDWCGEHPARAIVREVTVEGTPFDLRRASFEAVREPAEAAQPPRGRRKAA